MTMNWFTLPPALVAAVFLAGGGVAQTVGSPNGVHQTLKPHKAAMAAPRSLLAPVRLAPNAATGLAKPYGGSPIDVINYHYDNNRTGWNPTETDLTPATVKSGNFGLLANLSVDGNVFAQPLLVSNFTMPDNTVHDVLIIVTGHNSVYAFDAQSYATLWHVNLGQAQSTDDVGCGDVHPEYGISSTPVIVRSGARATIYLVAATEPSSYEFHTKLHALDLSTGQDLKPPVEISPTAKLADKSILHFDPQNQWSRAGLAYNNGSLYIGISSHCDNNAYDISGWLLRYDTNLALVKAFNTIFTPHGYELASIWMSGFAPAIDAAGNVFVVTGNGDFTAPPAKDWGESVLKLTPALTFNSSFTPYQYGPLNWADTDFGSGGVMLLPPLAGQKAPPMAVAMGKDAVLYLLRQNGLGGLSVNDANALDARRLAGSGGGLWGGPAYFNGPAGPTVFTQINGDVLRAFSVPINLARPAFLTQALGTSGGGYGGSLPIVSSNGAKAHTGVVWVVRRSAPIELEAYDADRLGQPIYSANIGNWSNPDDNNPFLTAMEANGRVYVATYLSVRVFGLTQ